MESEPDKSVVVYCLNNKRWVRGYDPFGDPPGVMPYRTGKVTFVDEPEKAKVFPSFADAWKFATQVHPTHPTRDDGRPNRPITAYTLEFVPVSASP